MSAARRAARPQHLLQLSAHLITSGGSSCSFFLVKLLASAARISLSGALAARFLLIARHLFDGIPHPPLPLYNTALRLFSRLAGFDDALRLYLRLLASPPARLPDEFTLPPVIRACSGARHLAFGRAVHASSFLFGVSDHLAVENSLVAMYFVCGDAESARRVFERMRLKDVVSWTSAISGTVQSGSPAAALSLFRAMRAVSADSLDFVLLVSITKAYTEVEDVRNGLSSHALAVKLGADGEQDLAVMLTTMYARFGMLDAARRLFDTVSSPGVPLWNSMVCGYAKNGCPREAVELFQKMVSAEVPPDSITLRSAISASAQLGSLKTASRIEDFVLRSSYKHDLLVNTALIDMFAKCGSIARARGAFGRLPDKDVVAWSALIAAHGAHGRGREAISLFEEMKQRGVRPNDVTFVGLLSACNHAGLVDEGWSYFHSMAAHHGVEPRHQHYAIVVDLLARAGRLDDAYDFIAGMRIKPEITVWGALLNACKSYGRIRLAKAAAERVFELDPANGGHYVQLSNAYASAGRWSDASKVRLAMRAQGAGKATGSSWIEVEGMMHAFCVFDASGEVFALLDGLERELKGAEAAGDVQLAATGDM